MHICLLLKISNFLQIFTIFFFYCYFKFMKAYLKNKRESLDRESNYLDGEQYSDNNIHPLNMLKEIIKNVAVLPKRDL